MVGSGGVPYGFPMENRIYLGVGGSVVCLDKTTGEEFWRTPIRRGQLTSIMIDGDIILAHSGGHLFGLKASSGTILWENPLKGLGYGYAIMASASATAQAATAAASQIQAQAAATAATAAVAASAAASSSS